MNTRISIIVPVYNTGEILRNTLDSILSQTFVDFEVILVDDGSKDESGRVCDEYASKDERFIVFHKENGGICDARNYGLSKCNGKYVAFCDHDDLFEPDLLENAFFAAEENSADVVKFNYKEISENKTTQLSSIPSNVFDVNSLRDSLYELNSLGYFATVWSFLYRRDWLQKTGAKFDVTLKHGGEDYDFNMLLIPYIRSFVVIPKVLYLHFIRASLSTSAKMYEDVMLHFLKTQILLNKVAKTLGCNPNHHQTAFMSYYGECVINFISSALKLNKSNQYISERLELFGNEALNISPLCKNILKSIRLNPKNTIAFVLSFLCLHRVTIILFRFIKTIVR